MERRGARRPDEAIDAFFLQFFKKQIEGFLIRIEFAVPDGGVSVLIHNLQRPAGIGHAVDAYLDSLAVDSVVLL